MPIPHESQRSLTQKLADLNELLSNAGLEHGRRKASKRNPRRQTTSNSQPTQSSLRSTTPADNLDVLHVNAWESYSWLLNGFSTRNGGVTTAYCRGENRGELNLGFTASDSRENVLENRRLFLDRIHQGTQSTSQLVTLRQIHSNLTYRVGRSHASQEALLQGDGLMTDEPGVLLGIQTADCIPVVVADCKQKAVAAFHAGWRGTLKRIVENGIGKMRMEFGSRPKNLIAAIGPGIGQCCYAVGEEVLHEFTSQFAYAADLFREIYDSDPIKEKYPLLFLTARAPGHSNTGPRLHLDLVEANRRQLLDAGLKAESIYVTGECTNCAPDRFFSYRASQGFTGRMLSAIGIRK